MRKNDKRKYLSPETEIVRFVDDIITTSGGTTEPTSPDGGGAIATEPEPSNADTNNLYWNP